MIVGLIVHIMSIWVSLVLVMIMAAIAGPELAKQPCFEVAT